MSSISDPQRRPVFVDVRNNRLLADPVGGGPYRVIPFDSGQLNATKVGFFGSSTGSGPADELSPDGAILVLNTATTQTLDASILPVGGTDAPGLIQLTDSVNSSSVATAPTANAVKQAYDLAAAALPANGGTLSGDLVIDSTGYVQVPVGNDGQRPGSPEAGMFRFSTTSGAFEGHNGTSWGPLSGSGGGGGVETFSAGTTGLTPGSPSSGDIVLGGTLAVANGGTGVTTSTGSGSVVLSTSPTLVTPNLGTPSAGSLGSCTGYTFANLADTPTTLSGYGITDAISTGGTLPVSSGGTGVTTSTGTGDVVLSTSPTLVTPNLGTPSAGDLTNCTGYTFDNLASKPTTLNGYGITDAVSTGATGVVTSDMILNGTIVNADISASAAIADTKLATISTSGKVANSATTATSSNTANTIVLRNSNGSFGGNVITANTFSGSGASLTNLPASQLTGTLPGGVLGSTSTYVGTTEIALNRASANQALTGISSVTLPGSAWGTVLLKASSVGTNVTITLPSTTGTVITTGDSGTVTSTMIANYTIVNGDISNSAAIQYSKLLLSNSIVNGDIAAGAAISDSKLATISSAGKVANSATTGVSTATANTLALRDSSGNSAFNVARATQFSWKTTESNTYFYSPATNAIGCMVNTVEAFRVMGTTDTRPRSVVFGKTDSEDFTTGVRIGPGDAFFTSNGEPVAYFNRSTSDGTIIEFRQANVAEGNIAVSGTTVSYNGAHLSRWSQLPGGGARIEILRGTVLSNLDEMCEWVDPPREALLWQEGEDLPDGVSVGDIKVPAQPGGPQANEQLNRMQVSSIEGDPNVAGVFQGWDDDDDTHTDDFHCAVTGDFIIRIGAGVTVQRGDLLMSAGDGTAKPQGDDIVRSKTVAKVTSTHVSCTYEDGSYCVPCVLMAC